MLTRTWEMQRRGVLHAHPVLAFTTAEEQVTARAYLKHLAFYAPMYGFGFVERKQKVMAARSAAAYLSSYFVTGSKKKATLQESVTNPHMPRSIIYVSPRLSMVTGLHNASPSDAPLPARALGRGGALCGRHLPRGRPLLGGREGPDACPRGALCGAVSATAGGGVRRARKGREIRPSTAR